MPRRALITGVTGQDGSYLAELLIGKGYEVHGMYRRSPVDISERIAHLAGQIKLHHGELLDQKLLTALLDEVRPHEVYNLAAQTFVPASYTQPLLTGEFTALGVTRILEAIRHVDSSIRLFQASSSEMFGKAASEPQDEQTPLLPQSPYGVAKTYAHWMTVNYRQSYGLFACAGIMFNHESPRRGLQVVSRKITDAAARIKLGEPLRLALGNLDAERDWGFAGDYVQAMWQMLQQERPADYVIATGVKHSVRELLERAFGRLGLEWHEHVDIDPSLFRRTDNSTLRGDASKARAELGWQPTVAFDQLVSMMVDADVARLRP